MINVVCKLKTYNDISLEHIRDEPCEIVSHHNSEKFIKIFINGNSNEYVVVNAKDLKAAIDNCTNTSRY